MHQRAFKTPLVPLIPILGVITCLFMMVFLPLDTWIRLIVWMIIGFDIYLYYGMKHSSLSDHQLSYFFKKQQDSFDMCIVSCGITGYCCISASWPRWNGYRFILFFNDFFSFLHILLYLQRLLKKSF